METLIRDRYRNMVMNNHEIGGICCFQTKPCKSLGFHYSENTKALWLMTEAQQSQMQLDVIFCSTVISACQKCED